MADTSSFDQTLSNATASLQKMVGLVDKLDNSFKGLGNTISGSFNGGGFGRTGNGNTGSTSGFSLGSSNAAFSNFGGGGSGGGGGSSGGIMGGVMQMVSGVSNMMPDVNATMSRMTQGYNVGLMNGFSGASNNAARQNIETRTMYAMRNGLTGPGSDMQFASIMASSGIKFSSAYNSTYMQNAREVSGLAKYMNVDNAAAAQSMANITSGPMSAQLMMNMGINTSDPRTGKPLSFRQIASQFEDRIGAGNITKKTDLLSAYHQGYLGSDLANSGLDTIQQQMILQDLLYKQKHGGKGIDFANTQQMDQLSKDNPMLAQYKMNYSDTRQMNKAEGAYKTGADAAVDGLTKLNEVAGNLASTFGAINSAASTFSGSRLGSGIGQVFSGFNNVLQGVEQAAASALGAGRQTQGTAFSSGSFDSYSGVSNSYSAAGSTGGSVGSSTAGATGGPGTSKPTTVTTQSASSAASNSKKNVAAPFSLIRPVSGGTITATFYSTGSHWKNGHQAIDFGVADGTPVVAAHSGKAHISTNLSSEVGNYIKIWSNDGPFATGYGHLSAIRITDGQFVEQGQLIGYSGHTGTNITGPHLHFELYQNGQRVDPAPYLNMSGAAAAAAKKASTSTNGNSNNTIDSSSSASAPPSASVSSQLSSVNGKLSYTTATDYMAPSVNYYGSGGASTSSSITSFEGSKYAASQTVTSKFFTAMSSAINPTAPLTESSTHKSGGNTVTINLSIANASDSEARSFANKVKTYLEEDRLLMNMGTR